MKAGLQLGKTEMLRGLRKVLNTDRPEDGRGFERGTKSGRTRKEVCRKELASVPPSKVGNDNLWFCFGGFIGGGRGEGGGAASSVAVGGGGGGGGGGGC